MRLATKYLMAFAGLATTGFIGFAGSNAVTTYRESVANVTEIQQEEGKVLAVRINAFFTSITGQLQEVNGLPWEAGILGLEDERAELHRLLKLNPAIHALWSIDKVGAERNRVSRTEPDEIASQSRPVLASDGAGSATTYGSAYFKDGSTPFVMVNVGRRGDDSPHLIAEISLRYVTEIVADAKIGQRGRAFVVDDTDQLVAHPSLSLVHRKVNLLKMPQVRLARQLARLGPVSTFARSPETNTAVLTSAVALAPQSWLLFVEQPEQEVMQPVWVALWRTLWLLVLLLVVSLLSSRWLAKRLTRPILALHHGAVRIGQGARGVQIPVKGEDELSALTGEFNRMAEQLDQSYADLEDKVRQRTQELATASELLRERANEADRANAAKTRFLATASHDLRQPLQAISLLVAILRERVARQEIEGLVDKVQRSVHALEGLFVSLLDVSRLDAGAVQPSMVDLRMSTLLRQIESNFAPQAAAHGIALDVVNSDAIVRTDPLLLERIVSNLVSNAIRYTTTGRILVGCRRRPGMIAILVIDTGPGIPPHLHNEIFEEFFQVPDVERDRTRGLGLGLGLSIVKRIADILGHRLLLTSRVGHGSTFGVEIPLVAGYADASPEPLLAARAPSPLAGIFVVVIDDDKENRFAIEALCLQWGCHVVSGDSEASTLDALQAHLRNPDLIITDYRLGHSRTGGDAIASIRKVTEVELPAILMTGDLSIRAGDLISAGPPVTLLHKPINAETLRVAAERLLFGSAVHMAANAN